jgi:asparagine synthase (glutamine-hydrolysing)
MCAIYGYFTPSRKTENGQKVLDGMGEALKHRGPDGTGSYATPEFGFGHARLAIIGAQNGAQPFEAGRTRAVVAGEIFNYVELRKELEAEGRRFRTLSDGEVVAHLFEKEGIDCLERLNGQFAIAIWDEKARELYLARDRFGIVPLCYASSKGRLAFASEAKGIFRYPGMDREADAAAIDQIFTFWTTVPGQTAFRGVREVPPGHFLKISENEIAESKYWELSFHPDGGYDRRAPEEWAEEVDGLLKDAVRLRLRSDGPVGVYASGGVDSSLVAALAKAAPGVETFSLSFDDARYDESPDQERVTAALGLPARTVKANVTLESLRRAVYHAERPFLRTAPAPFLALAESCRASGRKVALTGEGADELFLGYELFKEVKIRLYCERVPGSRKRARLLNRVHKDIPFFRSADSAYLKHTFLGGPEDDPFVSHRPRWNAASRLKNYFSGDFRERIRSSNALHALSTGLPDGFDDWDAIGRAQALETALLLGGYLLSTQGDRPAMAHAVELRQPFLDHRLAELAASIPPTVRMRGLSEKSLLRKVAARHLPQDIAQRPKKAYAAPALNADDPQLRELLSEAPVRKAGYFDPAEVNKLVKKARDKGSKLGETDTMALTAIATTQLFHETRF